MNQILVSCDQIPLFYDPVTANPALSGRRVKSMSLPRRPVLRPLPSRFITGASHCRSPHVSKGDIRAAAGSEELTQKPRRTRLKKGCVVYFALTNLRASAFGKKVLAINVSSLIHSFVYGISIRRIHIPTRRARPSTVTRIDQQTRNHLSWPPRLRGAKRTRARRPVLRQPKLDNGHQACPRKPPERFQS